MWIVASFHSTSLPFIQIVPVPGNPISTPQLNSSVFGTKTRKHESTNTRNPKTGNPLVSWFHVRTSLRFAAEGAAIRSGVEGLAAVPAEARLRCFARLQARLDVVVGDRVRA